LLGRRERNAWKRDDSYKSEWRGYIDLVCRRAALAGGCRPTLVTVVF
jgi:hypothetical protein